MHPGRVLLVGFDTKQHSYSPARSREFLTALRERLSALPGVQSVSFMDYRPFMMAGSDGRVRRAAGRDNHEEGMTVAMLMVGSRYFETLGIPVLRGRDFDPTRDAARELVIINEMMAQRLFGGEDPIGQTIEERVDGYWPEERGKNDNRGEIVGVVGNTQIRWLGEDTRPAMYRLIDRHPDKTVFMFGTTALLKTARPPGETVPLVRAEFRALDPNLAVFDIETMGERVSKALMIPRVSALLLAVFGAAGLVLAMVGLYGVLSYSVRRRTREIGIRMALGAQVSTVLRSVVGQGMAMAGVGLALGLALAAVMGRLFSAFLYGVSPIDPWTFTIVPVALLVVALAAAWTPARRAARIAPSTALRHE
jgi:predicted permease